MSLEINDMRAALDQITASFRDFAPMLFKHYSTMIEAGFTPEQAFVLVRDFHTRLIYPTPPMEQDDGLDY